MSDNPYEPPQTAETAPASVDTSYRFRDLSGLTRGVKVLLVISALISVVELALDVVLLGLLQEVAAGTDVQTQLEQNDAFQSSLGSLDLIIFLVTAVTFLTWIYRANANARALGARWMQYTPGWSVGWFFIPIANLWKPYQAMAETWQASHEGLPAEPGKGFVGLWWMLWIVNSVLNQIVFRLYLRADTVDEYLVATQLNLVALPVNIVLCGVAFLLVARIHEAQMEKRRVVESAADLV